MKKGNSGKGYLRVPKFSLPLRRTIKLVRPSCLTLCLILVLSNMLVIFTPAAGGPRASMEELKEAFVDEYDFASEELPDMDYRFYDDNPLLSDERYETKDEHGRYPRYDLETDDGIYHPLDDEDIFSKRNVNSSTTRSSAASVFHNNEIHSRPDVPMSDEDYISREPISINGNKDFREQAAEEGWPGDGKWDNPYIIEGYEIDGGKDSGWEYCIHIRNTAVHFIIRNNYLHNASSFGSSGIHLSVRNGIINNNTITNNAHGIRFLDSSADNAVTNNTIYSNIRGIFLGDSSDTFIANNYISKNREGIRTRSSSGTAIINNIISKGGDGIFHSFSDDSIIKGNTISNNWANGIRVDVSSGNIVSDNVLVSNSNRGLYLWFFSNSELSNNTVSDSRYGILLREGDKNLVSNNRLRNNDYGTILWSSTRQTLTNNIMENSSMFIDGNTLQQWNTHVIDTSNTVNGKPVYYWKDQEGDTVPNDAGQVILVNCTNIKLESLSFSNGSAGIQLGFSHDNVITNCTASNNKVDGINLYRSNNNSIIDSAFSDNHEVGIFLWRSSNNTISRNTASYNGDHGILIWDYSHGNSINGNEVLNNQNMGFYLWRSTYNTLFENIVSSNYYGVHIRDSEKNLICRNRFIENTIRGYDNGDNNWDLGDPIVGGKGGNYWSDYEGNDRGDGIGDSPHHISENKDNYPWMNPQMKEVVNIVIKPENATVKAGDNHTLSAMAFDENDNLIGNVGNIYGFVWTVDSEAGGTWINNPYNSEFAGLWSVTGAYDKLTATAILNVEPAEVDHIKITPEVSNVTAGEVQEYTASTRDQFGNIINDITDESQWYIEAHGGGNWTENRYTSEFAGAWTVTCTYDELTATATLRVEPGEPEYMEVVPENTVVTAGKDVNYAANLYDQFYNIIDGDNFEIDWSIEDEGGGRWNGSLYTSEFAGTWIVTGKHDKLIATAILSVEPGAVINVYITPEENLTIECGKVVEFSAAAYDRYGNLITDEVYHFSWWNTGGNGVFQHTTPGKYIVSASYQGVTSSPTMVTVEDEEEKERKISQPFINYLLLILLLLIAIAFLKIVLKDKGKGTPKETEDMPVLNKRRLTNEEEHTKDNADDEEFTEERLDEV